MSVHIFTRPLWIGYSPAVDSKWRPEGMGIGKWYQVIGYENGTIKLSSGKAGDASFFHFIGEDMRPCRLIHNNAILTFNENEPFPKAPASSGDSPGF